MQVIDTSNMTREQWLALRRQSIGASDAPVIAGLSKYKTRFQLWLEKTGQTTDQEAGEAARWGQRLEDDIADELKCRGVITIDSQVFVRGVDYEWQTATLDAIDDKEEVWEFKSAGFQTAAPLMDGVSSTLPYSWILQAHHQMMAADVGHINFAVFVGHRLQLFRFVVEHDQALEDAILELEQEFRQHVVDRTPPQDFDPADAALLLKHYSRVNGEVLTLDEATFGESCEVFKQSSLQVKYASQSRDKAKAELLGAMGEAEIAKVGAYELRRSIVNVKPQAPKPKAGYSYVKFNFSGLGEE